MVNVYILLGKNTFSHQLCNRHLFYFQNNDILKFQWKGSTIITWHAPFNTVLANFSRMAASFWSLKNHLITVVSYIYFTVSSVIIDSISFTIDISDVICIEFVLINQTNLHVPNVLMFHMIFQNVQDIPVAIE